MLDVKQKRCACCNGWGRRELDPTRGSNMAFMAILQQCLKRGPPDPDQSIALCLRAPPLSAITYGHFGDGIYSGLDLAGARFEKEHPRTPTEGIP